MGKYDSPRKSYPGRVSQPQAGRLSYVPTVCRSALDEQTFQGEGMEAAEGAAASVWDDAFDGLDGSDEPLPVPDMGPEDETKIVARTIVIPPIPEAAKKPKLMDPLAMLEAATIRSTPKPRD